MEVCVRSMLYFIAKFMTQCYNVSCVKFKRGMIKRNASDLEIFGYVFSSFDLCGFAFFYNENKIKFCILITL